MSTFNRPFDAKNGISIANTIIISNTSGTLNVSNVTLMNVVTLNVSGNIANVGNLNVSQNTTTGNLNVIQNLTGGNATFSGAVAISGNLVVTGTTTTLNSTVVSTNDQYFIIASNNTIGDILDYGFVGQSKNTSQGNVYSGLIKHTADQVWHLFEGYSPNPNTSSINVAAANVATLNANLIAQQITLGGINVNTWITSAYSSANQAYIQANAAYTAANTAQSLGNNGIFVQGGFVAFSPNINFVAANTSNLSIIATSNTSVGNGNVTITLDTRNPGSIPGIYYDDFFHNGFLVSSNAIPNFNDTASIIYNISANGSGQINVSSTVNSNLSLTSLNVSSGIVNVNTLGIFANSISISTASQVVLDTFASTGMYATAEYTVQVNNASSFHSTKIMVVNDGTNVYIDEYGTIATQGYLGTFTAAITSGNVQLLFTGINANPTTIRTVRYGIAV